VCRTTLAEAKESNVKRHYNTHAKLFEEWNLTDNAQRSSKYSELRGTLLNESSTSSATDFDQPLPKSVSKQTLPCLNVENSLVILGLYLRTNSGCFKFNGKMKKKSYNSRERLLSRSKNCGGTHVRKRTSFRQHAFKFKGFNKVPGFHQKYQSFECADVWNSFGT